MDKSKFSDVSPGELVQIDRADHPQRKDWAFVPHELPPVWEFASELWPLLAEARDRLGTLNGIGQTLEDPDLLLHPLQNREAITSSQIEGTFVTAEELLLFEMDPKEPKSARDDNARWLEVHNYNAALKIGCEIIQDRPIGSHAVRSMHSVLMRGVRGRDKSPGQFRSKQVQIGSNARYIAPPPAEVERLMRNLEDFITSEDARFDPLVKCFIVHYQFESIHPFEDGNGRVGRAVISLMLYKLLNHKRPWLYMSAFFDRFQDEYFSNLFEVSTQGAWARWIEFCLRGTISQANDAIRRCDRFIKLKKSFHERVTSPTPRSHQLIDSLFKKPIIKTTSVRELFGVHYQTAQVDIEKLVDAKILKELNDHRPKTYYSPEIMDVAYGRSVDF